MTFEDDWILYFLLSDFDGLIHHSMQQQQVGNFPFPFLFGSDALTQLYTFVVNNPRPVLSDLEPLRNFLLLESALHLVFKHRFLLKRGNENTLDLQTIPPGVHVDLPVGASPEKRQTYQWLLRCAMTQQPLAEWSQVYQKWKEDAFWCALQWNVFQQTPTPLPISTCTPKCLTCTAPLTQHQRFSSWVCLTCASQKGVKEKKTETKQIQIPQSRKRFSLAMDLEAEETQRLAQKKQQEAKRQQKRLQKDKQAEALGLPIHVATGKRMTLKQHQKENKALSETKQWLQHRAFEEVRNSFCPFTQTSLLDEHLVSKWLPALRKGARLHCRFKEEQCTEAQLHKYLTSQHIYDFKPHSKLLLQYLHGKEVTPASNPHKELLLAWYVQAALFLFDEWCKQHRLLMSQLTRRTKASLTKQLMRNICLWKKGPFEPYLSFFPQEGTFPQTEEEHFQQSQKDRICSLLHDHSK